ncbi:hypothetical protein JTE90_003807 [Oedothorax gibbosus]|uniref:Carboxylic ester hydrolase n=1 Tax=Oedothorax gibbosus TaxID=931172 RepID=A0AAV6VI74_9ARAC|nr:hypothetical protein JTE90_003807 [Oedothorax gibbosus]
MGVEVQLFVIALLASAIELAIAVSPPTAQLNNSRFIGQTVVFAGIPVQQFVGIRFAEPPVGKLRFQKPVPIKSYPAEVKATTFPKACLQYSIYPFPWYIAERDRKSEDCLFMNIWVPTGASPSNKKAVMYWIYGGGHRYGSMADPLYNGTKLAALGDIIVVTVNYRLNYFGFVTSNTSDAPGNLGVWDFLEGLKWVNRNIAAFGGDVSQITIAGESAGAINVGLLSISPLAEGLFARQIMESASPAYRRGDNNTQNIMYTQQLAESVGCATKNDSIYSNPKKVIECLQDTDADIIMKQDFYLNAHLVPQFGDEILPNNPREEIIKNNFRCKDLLIGTNKDEGSYSLALAHKEYFGFYGEKNPHVNRSFGESIIRESVTLFPDPEAIVNYYLPPNLQKDTNYSIRTQVYTAMGDTVLLCPAVYYAEKCVEQNKKVYYYHFNHRPSNSIWSPWIGTTHFDEVQFVFGRPVCNSSYIASECILSKEIIGIWSSFVKNGQPNIPWPLYDTKNRAFKILGPEVVTGENGKNGPHKENCEFLKPYFGF